MMLILLLLLLIFITILTAIGILVYRAKKGKTKSVREHYAFRCVALLFGLAGDIIAAVALDYSVWDLLAAIFGIQTQESVLRTTLSYGLILIIFFSCMYVVFKTYNQWDGPISRRQFQRDTEEFDESNIIRDCLEVILASIKENGSSLKAYRRIIGPADSGGSEITGDLPWHIEFAEMYSLMSNQVHIDIETEWHAFKQCFITTDSRNHNIAIYCTIFEPSEQDLNNFLTYIFQQNETYQHIIVAVKNGQKDNFSLTQNGHIIEFLFKYNVLNLLVNFSDYYRAIDEWYQRPLMQNTEVRINDIYVEPNCCLESQEKPFPLYSYVTKWLQEFSDKQLALLGDFGQGKTLFSLYLTYQMIHTQSERIPILIQLRNKSPRNSNEMEILSYFAAQYGINPQALSLLNSNGKLLLIFDGFDEMDLVGNDDIRKKHFQSLWRLVCPKSKILITGRPNYFLSRSEMVGALGLQTNTDSQPFCEALFLQPFSGTQIMQALRSSKESVRNGIKYIMDHQISVSFLDLISRPSHLFLVSQIWDERQLEKKYQNLTSAIILNEFMQNCFERQSAKKTHNSIPYFYLSPIEREYFMVGIAARMYKTGTTSITQDSFHNTVVELLDIFPEELSAENSAFFNLRNNKSVSRFANEDSNSLLAIINDVRTCGVLINDTVNSGLCFAHKSFLDLLTAKFFLGKSIKLHDNTMTISKALSKNSAFNPRLKNDFVVRKLLAELISAQINVPASSNGEEIKCKKIFEQCQKIITFPSFRSSPQKLLRSSIQEYGLNSAVTDLPRWKHYNESNRLSTVSAVAVFATLIFIVRCFQITHQYQEAAAQYYASLSITGTPPKILEGVLSAIKPTAPLLLFCAIVLLLYFFSTIRLRSTQEKADLVLLTWYHACKEHEISDHIILQQFPEKYAQAFKDYIEGRSLTEIQERLQNAKKISPWAGKY